MANYGAMDEDPEQAARAVELSESSGIPPTAIYGDVEGFERTYKAALSSQLIQNNPILANYLNSHPMAPRLSHDDLGNLDQAIDSINKIEPESGLQRWLKSDSISRSFIEGFGEKPLGQGLREGEDAIQRFYHGFDRSRPNEVEWALSHPALAPYVGVAGQALGLGELGVEGMMRTTSGLLRLGHDGLSQLFGDRFANEMAAMAEWGMSRGDIAVPGGGGGVGGIRATLEKAPLQEAIKSEAKRLGVEPPDFVLSPEATKTLRDVNSALKIADLYTPQGKEPPLGVHPLIDLAKELQAKEDIGKLDDALADSVKSATRDRSAEFFSRAIEAATGTREIRIDTEAIRKLYGDKTPTADDNLLGWIPKLDERLAAAEGIGSDIYIPMRDWLANVDPEVAKELHDDVSARDGGLTLNETKIKAEPKEVIADPVAAIRGSGGLESLAHAGDRKVILQRKERVGGAERGSHDIDILNERGEPIGLLSLSEQEGGRQLYIEGIQAGAMENFFYDPNFLGPSLVRDIGRQLKAMFPNAFGPNGLGITGHRVTGARKRAGPAAMGIFPTVKFQLLEDPQKFRDLLTLHWAPTAGTAEVLRGGAAFTPAEAAVRDAVLAEAQRIVPKADVEVVKGIDFPKVGAAFGLFQPSTAKMFVSLERAFGVRPGEGAGQQIGSLRHEAIHWLMRNALTDREQSALVQAAKDGNWRERFNIDKLYSRFSEAQRNEEAIAEAYRHWRMGEDVTRDTGVFQKIKDFMEAVLRRVQQALGRDLTWEQLFREIDEGRVGRREAAPEEGAEPLAMAGVEQFRRAANDNYLTKEEREMVEDHLQATRSGKQAVEKITEADVEKWNKIVDQILQHEAGEGPELAQARLEGGHEPLAMAAGPEDTQGLFETGRAAGVTQTFLDRIERLMFKDNAQRYERYKKAAEATRRRQTGAEIKARRTALRDEVREQLEGRPDLAVDDLFSRGGVKLHPDFLTDDQKARLPKDYIQKKDGVAPDTLAPYFGYTSGDALVERLGMLTEDRRRTGMTARAYLNRIIDIETDRRLNAEFTGREQADLDEARDQAISEAKLDMVHEETLRFAQQAGVEPKFTKEDTRALVQNWFNQMPVHMISFDRAMQDALKWGKKIEDALSRKKYDEAYRYAQARNYATIRAKLAKDYEKARRGFDRTAKTLARTRTSDKIAQDYLNWIHDLLLRTGYGLSRSVQDLQENISRQPETNLADFIAAKEATFFGQRQLDVPDFLADPNFRTNVNDLTAYEFEGLRQGIKILDKAGRNERSIMVGGERADLAATKAQMTKQLEFFGYGLHKMLASSRLELLHKMAYGLTAMETLLNRWDQGSPLGIFNRTIVHPLAQAANGKARLLRDIAKDLKDLDRPTKRVLERLVDAPFPDPSTPDGQGEWTGFNFGNVLMLLQNAGNDSNWNVTARGLGQDPVQLFGWLGKQITKDDVIRAQKLGAIFKKLIAQSDNLYERLTGATVEKIPLKPITFTFADGTTHTVDGWYHPLDRDPVRSSMWKDDGQGNLVRLAQRRQESAYGDADYFHPVSSNGYTKKRTGTIYPVNLDFNFVPTRLREIAHDVNFREPILEIEKIFADRLFQEDVAKYYGREYAKGLMPYLRSLAGAEGIRSENHIWADSYLGKAQQDIVSTYIGFNPFTILKHGPTAWGFSMREVGTGAFLRSVRELYGKPGSNWIHDFIERESEEIQRRERHWQDTLGGQATELSDKTTIRERIIDWGSKGVAKSDIVSAKPTWWAAYNKYLGQTIDGTFVDHGYAVSLADRAVRRAHGSTAETNLSPLARSGGSANRFFTAVYGFFGTAMQRRIEIAHQLNDIYNLGRQAEINAAAKRMPKLLGDFMTYVVWPTVVEEMVTGLTTEDRRGWGSYLLSGATMGLSSSVLYLRDLMYGLTTGHDPGAGLISSALHDIANVARDIRRGPEALNRQHAGKTVEDFITLFGERTGMAPKQIGKTLRFGIDELTGQQRAHTPLQWLRGLASGEADRRKR